ncbi:MAG: hypothetical protein Fur0032_07380 [Terrimicrobiaceae bacterium]
MVRRDSIRELAWWAIPLFALLYPLLTGRTHRDANEAAFYGLMAAGGAASVSLMFSMWTSPMGRHGRLLTVCGGLAVAYGVGLLLVTYGPRVDILLMALTWAGVIFCLARWREMEPACGRFVLIWLLAYVIWVLANCLLTVHQHVALAGSLYRRTGLASFGACVALFLVVVRFCRTPRRRQIVIHALVAGLTATALVASGQFFMEGTGWAGWFRDLRLDPRPMGTMGHPNWLGTGLCLGFPLALAGYFGGGKTGIRWLGLAAALIQFAGLLVCQTRGAWLAAAAGLVVVFWSERKKKGRWVTLLLGLLAVAAVLLPWRDGEISRRMMSFGQEVDFVMAGHDGAGTGRFGFWKYAINQLPGTLILGTGLDAFDLAGAGAPIDKAHSIYFEMVVTTGLPGLILGLGFFAACFWPKASADRRFPAEMARWGFRLVWVVYLIQGIFIHDVIHAWPLFWIAAATASLQEEAS